MFGEDKNQFPHLSTNCIKTLLFLISMSFLLFSFITCMHAHIKNDFEINKDNFICKEVVTLDGITCDEIVGLNHNFVVVGQNDFV